MLDLVLNLDGMLVRPAHLCHTAFRTADSFKMETSLRTTREMYDLPSSPPPRWPEPTVNSVFGLQLKGHSVWPCCVVEADDCHIKVGFFSSKCSTFTTYSNFARSSWLSQRTRIAALGSLGEIITIPAPVRGALQVAKRGIERGLYRDLFADQFFWPLPKSRHRQERRCVRNPTFDSAQHLGATTAPEVFSQGNGGDK